MSTGGARAALPRRLGRYEVLELLGRGAMGSVYRARDPALEREVAVKTLGGFLAEEPQHRDEYLERFQREARAAARLSHPNIVAVHDVGVDEETAAPFIVMEYVPGVSLATVLKENPVLPVSQALEIADQVAAALEEAHRHGIVHRDVKPGNVFVDPRGRVKVGDFGIARLPGSELTQAGVTLGTPGYLAPEVVRGAPADARADVFALGALAYALLSGQKPFPGVTPHALTTGVLDIEPPPPDAVRAEVPAAASQAVLHALAKSPQARTPSAEAFRRELTGRSVPPPPGADLPATVAGAAPTQRVATAAPAAPPTMTVATVPPRRRLPVAAVAAIAGVLLLAALLVAWRAGSSRRTATEVPAASALPSTPPAAGPSRAPASAAPRAAPREPERRAPPPVRVEAPARDEERRPPPPDRDRDKPGKGRGHGRGAAKGKKKG